MREWLGDLLEELLFIEATLPRTLASLIWRPGDLTKEWWRGRRARYVAPLRLYLLVALPFFFVFTTIRTGQPFVGSHGLGSVVALNFYASGRPEQLPDVAEPLPPLSPDSADDPVARARWQRRFEQRRIEALTRLEARNTQMERGFQRVLDLIPVAVGIIMVPLLAGLLALNGDPSERFVGRMVFSLHLHTVGFTLAVLGWIFGHGLMVAAGGSAVYLGVAHRRLREDTVANSVAIAILIPLFYAATFLVVYVLIVSAMAHFSPDWMFAT